MRNQKIIFICQILVICVIAVCMFFFSGNPVFENISYFLFGLLAYWSYSSLMYILTLKMEAERSEYERGFYKNENERMRERVGKLSRQLENLNKFHSDLKEGYNQQHEEIVRLTDELKKCSDLNRELGDVILKLNSDLSKLYNYCEQLSKVTPVSAKSSIDAPVLNFKYSQTIIYKHEQ